MPYVEPSVEERAVEIRALVREAMKSAEQEEQAAMDRIVREVRERHERDRRTLGKFLRSTFHIRQGAS